MEYILIYATFVAYFAYDWWLVWNKADRKDTGIGMCKRRIKEEGKIWLN